MSVSNTASTASFVLDQTTSTFTFTFRALTSTPTDIKAIITTNSTNQNLTYTTDYTVAVDADGVGGVLTLVSPATHSKGTLTVYRETTNLQESDYDDYNQFPADTLETDLDRRTLVSQEQAEKFTRTLLLPITVTGVSTTLPTPESEKVIGWSTGALTLCNYANAATSVTAAASSATAALASQNAAASSATSAGLYASTASTQALTATTQALTATTQAAIALAAAGVASIGTIAIVVDGGGGTISTGKKATVVIPFACTLNNYTMTANTTGSIVIDINRSTYDNYPTTASMPGSGKEPTISSSTKAQDTDITNWTSDDVVAGDVLEFEVDSVASISTVTLSLKYTRA